RLRLRTDPAAGSARSRPPAPHRPAVRLRVDFSGHLRRELHPAPGPGALPVHGAPSLEGGGGLLSSFVGVRFLNLLARMLSRPGPAGNPFPAPYRAGRPAPGRVNTRTAASSASGIAVSTAGANSSGGTRPNGTGRPPGFRGPETKH